MATPEKQGLKIVSLTSGAAVGVCLGYNRRYEKQCVELHDEDSMVVDQLVTVRRRGFLDVQYAHTPPAEVDTATGQATTLVERKCDGNTLSTPLGSCKLTKLVKSKSGDELAQYDASYQQVGTTAQPTET
jgi:hypothetical protein